MWFLINLQYRQYSVNVVEPKSIRYRSTPGILTKTFMNINPCVLVPKVSALKSGNWPFWPKQNLEITLNFMATKMEPSEIPSFIKKQKHCSQTSLFFYQPHTPWSDTWTVLNCVANWWVLLHLTKWFVHTIHNKNVNDQTTWMVVKCQFIIFNQLMGHNFSIGRC